MQPRAGRAGTETGFTSYSRMAPACVSYAAALGPRPLLAAANAATDSDPWRVGGLNVAVVERDAKDDARPAVIADAAHLVALILGAAREA